MRWVEVTPGVISQELHILWTIDYYLDLRVKKYS